MAKTTEKSVIKDKDQLTPQEKWKVAADNLKKELKKIDKREEKIYFFVADTKGNCNGELMYIYHTVKALRDAGYDARILEAEENEYIGVEAWMGKAFADLPHYNIQKDHVNVDPADILIIPELFSNVMYRTMKLPCKRIVLLSNYGYMTDVIEPGRKWTDYGITECIATTNALADKVKMLFPHVETHVLHDYISDEFKSKVKLKKPFVNIISKDVSDTNRIVKEFYWRYPTYQWLPFRGLKNLDQQQLAEALDESFLTIWVDREAGFGYSALCAMKEGSLVLGMLPEGKLDWDDEEEHDSGIVWFEKVDDVFKLIVGITDSYLTDELPQNLLDKAKKVAEEYTQEKHRLGVLDLYVHTIIENRKKELEDSLKVALENAKKK